MSANFSRTKGTMSKPSWFNDNGVVTREHEAEFQQLAQAIKELLRPLEDLATYRDLYELGWQASASAVSELVVEHVNQERLAVNRPRKSRKRRKIT